jgi:hypothetical protein
VSLRKCCAATPRLAIASAGTMATRASTRPRAERSEPNRARKGNDNRRRGNANPRLGKPRTPAPGPCPSCSTRNEADRLPDCRLSSHELEIAAKGVEEQRSRPRVGGVHPTPSNTIARVRKRKPGGIGKSLADDSYFVKRVVELLAAGNQFSRGAAGSAGSALEVRGSNLAGRRAVPVAWRSGAGDERLLSGGEPWSGSASL